MAISILSQPTTPNCTYTNLVYNVSSTNTLQPQFQYVMDVYASGSATRLARIKQYPNPNNTAVFDPHWILNDYVEYSEQPLDTTDLTTENQVMEFDIKFGEEYGTSPSSITTVYPNLQTTSIEVSKCIVDPNSNVVNEYLQHQTDAGYNWIYSGSNKILSDRPNGVEHALGAPLTFTAFNGTGTSSDIIWKLNGSTIETETLASGKFKQDSLDVVTDSGDTSVTYQLDPAVGDIQQITIPLRECENYPVTCFWFINNYGMWETYTVSNVQNVSSNIKRQTYKETFVDYSNSGAYNRLRGGERTYATLLQDTVTVVTDPLGPETAAWLTQLIESPKVWVSYGDTLTVPSPVQIQNSSYDQFTNLRGQKLFQYTLEFKYTNQRRGR
jgi:hypothetical protein